MPIFSCLLLEEAAIFSWHCLAVCWRAHSLGSGQTRPSFPWAPAILIFLYILEDATFCHLLAFTSFISSAWNPSLPGKLLLLLSLQVSLPWKPFLSHPRFCWFPLFLYSRNTLYFPLIALSCCTLFYFLLSGLFAICLQNLRVEIMTVLFTFYSST